jgi:hypothetical protein
MNIGARPTAMIPVYIHILYRYMAIKWDRRWKVIEARKMFLYVSIHLEKKNENCALWHSLKTAVNHERQIDNKQVTVFLGVLEYLLYAVQYIM